ncbi:nesprin-1-like [Diadema setosum]|uniref:nesprin-1-like n=1 Tax=Diadema setosum TaxID=31175 RepID=UPI003B3B37EC
MASTQVAVTSHANVEPALANLSKLSKELQPISPEAVSQAIQREVGACQKRCYEGGKGLKTRLESLEKLLTKWREYEADKEAFVRWLEAGRERLDMVQAADGPPDQTFNTAKDVFSEIFDKYPNLESMEGMLQELVSPYPRSVGVLVLESDLASLQTQWEELCGRARALNAQLSDQVSEWNAYRRSVQQLVPWLDGAKERLDAESGQKFETLDNVCQHIASVEALEKELEENRPIMNSIRESRIKDEEGGEGDDRDLEPRWASLEEGLSKCQAHLDGIASLWRQYLDTKDEMLGWMEDVERRIGRERGETVGSTQQLKDRCEALKNLSSECKAQAPKVEQVLRLNQALREHCLPAGAEKLSSEADHIKTEYERLSRMPVDRTKQLEEILAERQRFSERLSSLHDAICRQEKALGTQRNIEREEMKELLPVLKKQDAELSEATQDLTSITTDLEPTCRSCDSGEALALSHQVTAAGKQLEKVQEVVTRRITYFQFYIQFEEIQYEVLSRFQKAQPVLTKDDPTSTELAQELDQLQALVPVLDQWRDKTHEMDQLAKDSGLSLKPSVSYQDSARQAQSPSKPQSPPTALVSTDHQQLVSTHGQLVSEIKSKLDRVTDKTQKMKEFEERRRHLAQCLDDLQKKLAKETEVSRKKDLEPLARSYEDCQKELARHRTDLDRITRLGIELVEMDPKLTASIEPQVNSVREEWNRTDDQVSNTAKCTHACINLWEEMDRSQPRLQEVVKKAEDVCRQPIRCSNKDEADHLLRLHESALSEVDAAKEPAQHLAQSAQQLANLLPKITNRPATSSPVQPALREVQELPPRLDGLSGELEKRRAQLRRGRELWEVVSEREKKLNSWLGLSKMALERMPERMDDSDGDEAKTNLQKFKDEALDHENDLQSLAASLAELKSLNLDEPIPVAEETFKKVEAEFVQAKQTAMEAETNLSEFSNQTSALRAKLADLLSWLQERDAEVEEARHPSVPKEQLVRNHKQCQTVDAQLKEKQSDVDDLVKQVSAVKERFPMANTASLQKSLEAVLGQHQSTQKSSQEVQENIAAILQEDFQKAHKDMTSWLDAAEATLGHSTSTEGSLDELKAKHSAIKALQSSLFEGKQLLEAAQASTSHLTKVLPCDQQASPNQTTTDLADRYASLAALSAAKERDLAHSVDVLAQYETCAKEVSARLDKTKEETEGLSKPCKSPDDIKKQLSKVEALLSKLNDQRPVMDDLLAKTAAACEAVDSPSIPQHASDINQTYQDLINQLEELQRQLQASCDSGGRLQGIQEEVRRQLQQAEAASTSCLDPAGDRNVCEDKLQAIKALEEKKQKCQEKLIEAQNILPAMAPYLSPAGQEALKEQTAALQREVDNLAEQLDRGRHDVEKSVSDWTQYEECLARVNEWLASTDAAVDRAAELRDTLDNKHDHLAQSKTLQEDIEKQVSVLDDLRSKAEALTSSNSPDVKEQIEGQLSQATHKLNSATNRLKDLVNNQEKAVEDHENFDSSVKELSQLMSSIDHSLTQLGRVPDDKQAVEEALKRVQALKTQIPVGQDLIHKVDERARATLASTTAPGQPAIKDQVLSVRDGWNAMVTRLTNEEAALAGRLGGWNEYDGLMDGLERWLGEAEETLKETGRPREDLEGKREAVEQCKGLKSDIASRSPQTKVLAEKASKLSNKKEIARAKEVINRFRKLHTETNC